MRLQTYVKNNGNYTKSQTILLQKENRILVNGKKENLSFNLKDNDVVTIDNKVIEKNDFVYFIYNKPIGIVCTNDINVENNIIAKIGYDKRIYTVGRLDKDSHGLIILTNDNKLCHRVLTHDDIEKEYLVKVKDKIDDDFIINMSKSVILRGKPTKESKVIKVDDYSFKIILTEGKYHQIRKTVIINHNRVVDLERIRIGKIELRDLSNDEIKEIKDLPNII